MGLYSLMKTTMPAKGSFESERNLSSHYTKKILKKVLSRYEFEGIESSILRSLVSPSARRNESYRLIETRMADTGEFQGS